MRLQPKKKPTADDVRRVALAALVTRARRRQAGRQEEAWPDRCARGRDRRSDLHGRRAAFKGRRFVQDQIAAFRRRRGRRRGFRRVRRGNEEGEEPEAEEEDFDEDDERDEPEAEEDDFDEDDEDDERDEPEAEEEDFDEDDERDEPEAEEDDFDEDDERDEPEADEEDYDEDDERESPRKRPSRTSGSATPDLQPIQRAARGKKRQPSLALFERPSRSRSPIG